MGFVPPAWYEVGIWSTRALKGLGSLDMVQHLCRFSLDLQFSTDEKYGSWMNRELHEPSGARQFWSNHWAGILVFTSFLIGLAMRIQWYAVPSMNACTGTWDMTGGSTHGTEAC